MEQLKMPLKKTYDSEESLMILSYLVLECGDRYSDMLKLSGSDLISTTSDMEILEENDEYIITKYINTRIVKKPKNDSMFIIYFKPQNKTIVEWGKCLGISRQAASKHKAYIDKLLKEGCGVRNDDRGIYFISSNQLRLIYEYCRGYAVQTQERAIKVCLYLIFNIKKFSHFNRRYHAAISTMAKDTGCSINFIQEVIADLSSTFHQVLIRTRTGNNFQKLGSEYCLTPFFSSLEQGEQLTMPQINALKE